MSSPLNDSTIADWFRRFDAAARHLPAEDRAAQHEELHQHLDALIAANLVLGQSPEMARADALTRLGDPSQIGRKLDREWQQSRTGFRMDMKAIGLGVSLYVLVLLVINLNNMFWYGQVYPFLTAMTLGCSITVLRNVPIGLIYPRQAIKAAIYSYLSGILLFWIWFIVSEPRLLDLANRPQLWAVLAYSLLRLPQWMIGSVVVAYLASVTRRGWYRPTLTDFKVSLPHRRAVSPG